MALGVLNNLSAIYAEHNLNNTSNSLQTVLEQLSSGSKINSGADDAAGLSLVNGLEANQTALTQSETNATEGVGLLQVADGALSQVTSLLDRAITLATEASNGTLNTSQEAAANQEYQSILSEINNIGKTTTYNQETVFGSNEVAIYTGDSSVAGSSVDKLNIRTLSESSVGDTGGKMAYSDGSNNIFINLSNTNSTTGKTTNAQATDTLNAGGVTTINVNYLVKGANDTESTATTSISVGTGTSYANTANGLISAINSAGLGLSASFVTQAEAGVTGGGTQTGIEITGGLLSAGVDPSASSTSGTLNPSGISANELLTQGQTVNVTVGGVSAASVTINSSTSTLTELAAAINNHVGGTAGLVTATVITNGDGTQSLSLADATNSGGVLAVTTGGNTYRGNVLTDGTASVDTTSLSLTSSSSGAAGSLASVTLGVSGTNSSSQTLTGSIVLANSSVVGANPITFVMGGVGSGAGSLSNGTYTVNGNTLGDLAAGITAATGFDASASVSATGITITSTTAGTTLEQVGSSSLKATVATVSNTVDGVAATSGTDGTTTIAMNGGTGQFALGDTLVAGGSIVLTNGSANFPGSAMTFTVGAGTNGTPAGTYYTTAGAETVNGLITAINASTATSDMSASLVGGKIVVSSTSPGTTITMSATTLDDDAHTVTGAVTQSSPSAPAISTGASITTSVSMVSPNNNQVTGTGDSLAGSVVISNGGVTDTFVMGTGANTYNGIAGATHNVFYTGASTLASLKTAINAETADTAHGSVADLGVSAALDTAGSGLTFTPVSSGTSIAVNSSALTDTSTLSFTTPPNGSTNTGQNLAGVIALTDGGKLTGSGTVSGTLTVTNNGVIDTFVMGAASNSTLYGVGGGTFSLTSTSLSDLIGKINAEGSDTSNSGVANLNLTASLNASTGGIYIQSSQTGATGLTTDTSGLTIGLGETGTSGTNGAAGSSHIAAFVNYTNGGTNAASDPITGSIVLTNTANGGAGLAYGGGAVTFHVGSGTDSATDIYTGTANQTMQGLANVINTASATYNLDLSAVPGSNGLTVTSQDQTSSITLGSSTLVDQYGAVQGTQQAGADATAATNAFATVGTTGTIGATDALSGTIVLSNGNAGAPGTAQTFVMGTTANVNGATITTAGTTLADLATAINQDSSNLGLNATVVNGVLNLQATAQDTTIAVTNGSGSALTDTATETVTSPSTGVVATASTATMTLASGTLSTSNVLTGSVAISANGANSGNPITFVMGTTAASGSSAGTLSGNTFTVNGNTLGDLENAIDSSSLNLTAGQLGGKLTLTSTVDNATAISVTGDTLNDAFSNAASTASLGSFASSTDIVSGSIKYNLGGTTPETIALTSGETVAQMVDQINGASNNHPYGVTASISAPNGNGFVSVTLTSNTYGSSGDIESASGTSVVDNTATASLDYYSSDAYNTGLSSGTIASGTEIYDSSSGQTGTAAGEATIVSDTSGMNGIATISYSDGAGESLSSTDLTTQSDAQTALNKLNLAVTDVAAQDGYIGAQINTLDSISQVMSTQQENVVSAQNAVQATDYASATSNMSKYEILSQTGIAALAQANTVQQEVTKLLQ